MRFRVGDIVKMGKNDPHYKAENWKIIRDKEGVVVDINESQQEPIEVEFEEHTTTVYMFEEHEVKLVRRANAI